MIKYLEVPDFHFDMKHLDTCIKKGKSVYNAIKNNGIDFVVLPGDLHNKPIISSNTGGLPTLIEIVKSWLELCPVAAIEGTPSHDGPGAYAALEEAGLVLLRPGKVYGFFDLTDSYEHNIVGSSIESIDDQDETEYDLRAILFGIPELNTDNIHARLNISAEEANAEAINQFNNYIEHFIAPERARFQDIPAIGVLHGVVSDAGQEFSDDVIIKASDIVIKTDLLARADLTRWALGHIHIPWESEKICAGYAGSSGLTWGETGFVPAMNMVELAFNPRDFRKSYGYKWFINGITRIPYGTPERVKVLATGTINEAMIEPDKAYWIESLGGELQLPDNLHPWSRITHRTTKLESRRVTKEEAEKVKTLAETFKLFDPEVAESVLKKVDTLDYSIMKIGEGQTKVKLKSLTVKGCVFFKEKTAHFSTESITDLAMIIGPNGSGKSSLVSFCSPYPVIIGKDTKSGRLSAIKDFFTGRESSIEKTFTVSGETHRHLINIKAAHTNSAKTECYIFIHGVSVLDRGTFDEMFQKCEELYGSFEDYLLTTFYVQPLQGKTGSSLMSASMTEIRNLVQSIAGIDREKEKRFALDKVLEHETEITSLQNWISGAVTHSVKPDELNAHIKQKTAEAESLSEELSKLKEEGEKVKSEYELLLQKKEKNDKELARKESDGYQIHDLNNELHVIIHDTMSFHEIIENAENYKKLYERQKNNEAAELENKQLKNEYDEKVLEYRKELSEKQDAARRECSEVELSNKKALHCYNTQKKELENNINNNNEKIVNLNKPCFNCGKLDPEIVGKIKAIETANNSLSAQLSCLSFPEMIEEPCVPTELNIPIPTPPEYKQVEQNLGLSSDTLQKLEHINQAETKLESLESQKAAIEEKLEKLKSAEYMIDHGISTSVQKASEQLEAIRQDYSECNIAMKQAEAEINIAKESLEDMKEKANQIEEKKQSLSTFEADLKDWKYIAAQLQPSKIPAMELDIILDEIDEEATQNIAPYRDGVFFFKTVTQEEGKKSAVDRFNIIIHNNETGKEKSFIEFSPGQKAFVNDAYVKALIKKRNERSRKNYSPIIIDEADGPIHPDDIPAYYEIQQKYWNDKKTEVLVISHAVNAHEYISKHISIEEVLS